MTQEHLLTQTSSTPTPGTYLATYPDPPSVARRGVGSYWLDVDGMLYGGLRARHISMTRGLLESLGIPLRRYATGYHEMKALGFVRVNSFEDDCYNIHVAGQLEDLTKFQRVALQELYDRSQKSEGWFRVDWGDDPNEPDSAAINDIARSELGLKRSPDPDVDPGG